MKTEAARERMEGSDPTNPDNEPDGARRRSATD